MPTMTVINAIFNFVFFRLLLLLLLPCPSLFLSPKYVFAAVNKLLLAFLQKNKNTHPAALWKHLEGTAHHE